MTKVQTILNFFEKEFLKKNSVPQFLFIFTRTMNSIVPWLLEHRKLKRSVNFVLKNLNNICIYRCQNCNKNINTVNDTVSTRSDQRIFKSYRARNMYLCIFIIYIIYILLAAIIVWTSVRDMMRMWKNLGWNSQSSLYSFANHAKVKYNVIFLLKNMGKSCALYILINIFQYINWYVYCEFREFHTITLY